MPLGKISKQQIARGFEKLEVRRRDTFRLLPATPPTLPIC
jgi:hypothetical protein